MHWTLVLYQWLKCFIVITVRILWFHMTKDWLIYWTLYRNCLFESYSSQKNDPRTSARTCHRNATELFQHNWPHTATLYDYLTLEFMAIGQWWFNYLHASRWSEKYGFECASIYILLLRLRSSKVLRKLLSSFPFQDSTIYHRWVLSRYDFCTLKIGWSYFKVERNINVTLEILTLTLEVIYYNATYIT